MTSLRDTCTVYLSIPTLVLAKIIGLPVFLSTHSSLKKEVPVDPLDEPSSDMHVEDVR